MKHLKTHPLRGAIFESMVVAEFVKERANRGLPVNLYYWRDKTGHEIDLIVDKAGKLLPVEIKSGKTIIDEFFRNLVYWKNLSGVKRSLLLYGGTFKQKRSSGDEVFPWKEGLSASL